MKNIEFKLPSAAAACLYYLSNGWVIFAEGDAVKDQDEHKFFDVTNCVAVMTIQGPNGPTINLAALGQVLYGQPTFYRYRKTAIQAITDIGVGGESFLAQLRACRAGLTVVPTLQTAEQREID